MNRKTVYKSSSALLISLFLISMSTFGAPIENDFEVQLEHPVPYPLCDPLMAVEDGLDPDPVSWRIAMKKITPAMRKRLIRVIDELGPDPHPWKDSEYCVLVY